MNAHNGELLNCEPINVFLRMNFLRIILLTTLFILPLSGFAQEHPYADSLKTEFEKCTSDTHKVTLLNLQSKYWGDYDIDLAIDYAQQAIDLGKKTGFRRGEAWGYMNLGLSFGGKGNFIAEISQHNKAIPIFLEVGDTLYAARALGNLAVAEYRIGDYRSSTQHNFQAIEYYSRIHYEWGA